MKRCFILVVALLASSTIAAAAPIDPALQTRFNGLLKRMDDDDWKVREQATTEVQKLPIAVLPLVESALKSGKLSPEVQERLGDMVGDLRNKGVQSEKTRQHEAALAKVRDFTLANYASAGDHSPKWDALAREGLVRHSAVATFNGVGKATLAHTADVLQRAVDAGCTDPLVRLELAIDRKRAAGPALDQFEEVDAITGQMLKSKYAAKFKIMALEQRADARSVHFRTTDLGPDHDKYLADLDAAAALIGQTKGDPQPNEEAPYITVLELFRLYLKADAASTKRRTDLLNQFAIAMPGPLPTAILRGNISLNILDQGGVDSSTRTKLLQAAGIEADRALQVDPHSLLAAKLKMKSIDAIAEPEKYRQANKAVLAIDPDDYDAHFSMALFLARTADHSDRIAFADECIKTKAWSARTPLVGFEVILRIGNEGSFDGRTKYFQQPEIWNRISTVYEGILDVNPQDSSLRSFYAFWCCTAEKWDLAAEQFNLLGDDIDPTPFETEALASYYRGKAFRLATTIKPLPPTTAP